MPNQSANAAGEAQELESPSGNAKAKKGSGSGGEHP